MGGTRKDAKGRGKEGEKGRGGVGQGVRGGEGNSRRRLVIKGREGDGWDMSGVGVGRGRFRYVGSGGDVCATLVPGSLQVHNQQLLERVRCMSSSHQREVTQLRHEYEAKMEKAGTQIHVHARTHTRTHTHAHTMLLSVPCVSMCCVCVTACMHRAMSTSPGG